MLRDLSYRYKIPLAFTRRHPADRGRARIDDGGAKPTNPRESDDVCWRARRGSERCWAGALADPIRKDAVWPAYLTIQGLASAEARDVRVRWRWSSRTPRGACSCRAGPSSFRSSRGSRTWGSCRTHPRATPRSAGTKGPAAIEDEAGDRLLMVVPIEFAGASLGRVILIYPRSRLLPAALRERARGTVWTTVLVLLALVPMGWAWGSRVAAPLVAPRGRPCPRSRRSPSEEIALPRIRTRDEIGRLAGQFRTMLQDLREKREVERQMVATERLAALGRLSAGVAHENQQPARRHAHRAEHLPAPRRTGSPFAPDGVAARARAAADSGRPSRRCWSRRSSRPIPCPPTTSRTYAPSCCPRFTRRTRDWTGRAT